MAADVDPFLEGLYVAGSIATGDYRPGVSDIDAVALVEHVPPPSIRKALVQTHERLVRDVDGGSALHCVYVSRPEVADLAHGHWTWAFNELFRRPLSGIARAELLADPVIVAGPPPSSWLPPMSIEALRDAARSELAGYWTMALRKPAIWMHDVYIDRDAPSLSGRSSATGSQASCTDAETRRPCASMSVRGSSGGQEEGHFLDDQ